MQNSVAVLDDNHVQGSADAPQVWYARTPSEEAVFHGEDELGRTGWFLRLEVTGLFPRRCGPFASREEAVETLDRFLSDLVPGALCELGNELDAGQCVVEGVQPITATANEG
ncbi:MAG: hypothetical protein Nkreftii_002711 [Candidatus Nitrospira kreftii]|uniref:Uncharacterized protein n=1 Tax=Candidatus Nitrospira kreftii TaxID=2652173 RepID=A0A7S8IZA7_9BACT|nr:MAG: hypothetical protein Nkreftii_002711 [Candidatus Nitrospira kreftii]